MYSNFFSVCYLGELQFMKMGENEVCQPGAEIKTKDECDSVKEWAITLGINNQDTKEGSWTDVPYQCSYQQSGGRLYFNRRRSKVISPNYLMICKKGMCILFLKVIAVK